MHFIASLPSFAVTAQTDNMLPLVVLFLFHVNEGMTSRDVVTGFLLINVLVALMWGAVQAFDHPTTSSSNRIANVYSSIVAVPQRVDYKSL